MTKANENVKRYPRPLSTSARRADKARYMTANFADSLSTMRDVREQVDRIDRELIALLGQRFACMAAAARIKTDRDTVRDEARKAAVIANAQGAAAQAGVPVALVGALWEMLVESSIAYELELWDQRSGRQ
jgi:isochorismate pyruvate lyase